MGFPDGASGKEPACECRRHKRLGFDPWVRKIPWRRAWQPTPVFLPGESNGQRSQAGYSPWGHKELETTEQLLLLVYLSPGFGRTVYMLLGFPNGPSAKNLPANAGDIRDTG